MCLGPYPALSQARAEVKWVSTVFKLITVSLYTDFLLRKIGPVTDSPIPHPLQ